MQIITYIGQGGQSYPAGTIPAQDQDQGIKPLPSPKAVPADGKLDAGDATKPIAEFHTRLQALLKTLHDKSSTNPAKDAALKSFISADNSKLGINYEIQEKINHIIHQINTYNKQPWNIYVDDNISSSKFYSSKNVLLNTIQSINYVTEVMSIINSVNIEGMNKRQKEISEANNILALMRAHYPNHEDPKISLQSKAKDWITKKLGTEMASQFDIPKVQRYEQGVMAIKGWIDDQNSLAQLDMIFIKKIANEYNQFIEIKNNLLDKQNKSNVSIINTLRY